MMSNSKKIAKFAELQYLYQNNNGAGGGYIKLSKYFVCVPASSILSYKTLYKSKSYAKVVDCMRSFGIGYL